MSAGMSAATRRLLLPALALCAAPALAQTATPQGLDDAPASDSGRYSMQQTPDGFLRLDTRTGKVSYCVVKDGAARCTLAADEREAYEREIAALKSSGKPATSSGPRLPTDDEIDRTLTVMQKLWRGLNRMIAEDPPATPRGGQL